MRSRELGQQQWRREVVTFLKEGLRVGIVLMLTLVNSSSTEIVFTSLPGGWGAGVRYLR